MPEIKVSEITPGDTLIGSIIVSQVKEVKPIKEGEFYHVYISAFKEPIMYHKDQKVFIQK